MGGAKESLFHLGASSSSPIADDDVDAIPVRTLSLDDDGDDDAAKKRLEDQDKKERRRSQDRMRRRRRKRKDSSDFDVVAVDDMPAGSSAGDAPKKDGAAGAARPRNVSDDLANIDLTAVEGEDDTKSSHRKSRKNKKEKKKKDRK